jgi:hypothetical protein
MSHFIENTYALQSEPVIRSINKEIIMPPMSNFKSCGNSGCDGEGERKMLRVMFFHLKNE